VVFADLIQLGAGNMRFTEVTAKSALSIVYVDHANLRGMCSSYTANHLCTPETPAEAFLISFRFNEGPQRLRQLAEICWIHKSR
jgi:hypothetical protein